MTVALIVLGTLGLLFVVSAVLPRWLDARARYERVTEFERRYLAHEAGDESQRPWLIARRAEMQRDAQKLGRGHMVIAPPPAVGGHVTQHAYFGELFDETPYALMVQGDDFLKNELATIAHELEGQTRRAKRNMLNPWAWLRLSFEQVVGLPRYIIKRAGFSAAAADSKAARIVTVLWSVVVGIAGIGSFVLALLAALDA